MADQDFNIKVVTTADTSGLRATSAELDSVKRKAEAATAAMNKQAADAEAKWASSPINPKNATGGAVAGAGAAAAGAGLSGTAVGIGTIVTLLTLAINKWKDFNDELDRSAELSLVAIAKFRELGESVLDMQDKAINARRLATEPLEQSIERLTREAARLKVEMALALEAGELDDWKKLNAQLALTQSQLKGVTSELEHQTALAEKAAQKNAEAAASFLKGAVETSSPQTKAVLMNEEAARRAREAGDERGADLFQKSADRFKASMTPEQRDEYEGLTKPVRLGPQAGVGESQQAIDDISRNKINFDRQLRGEAPLPPGAAQGNDHLSQAIEQALGRVMSRYWGSP